MTNELGTRRLYVPRGRDPQEDLNILVDCIATSDADLFAQGSQIVWLKDTGELVGTSRNTLAEIIAKYIVTKHPLNHADKWQVEFHPFEPDEMTLRALLKEESGLVGRLPKWPSEPTRLSEQQQLEVRMRLGVGESKDRIADAYGTDVDTIKRLAR
jgi:hypothetical protein